MLRSDRDGSESSTAADEPSTATAELSLGAAGADYVVSADEPASGASGSGASAYRVERFPADGVEPCQWCERDFSV